ncbi:MAG: glycosyltransferase family 2 protein [Anaerolineales bacterium]|jgi:glycosyltransferase involved in cell wall biosynthesis
MSLKLSVIMPVYNEEDTLEEIVQRVRAVGLASEIVIVDDGSKDRTREILTKLSNLPDVRVILHEKNHGKGAAVVTGIRAAVGDVMIVQDADLEYDPQDYRLLLPVLEAGEADVVYGSRFARENPKAFFAQYLANRFLTISTNLLYGSNLTDMETCYKVFRREIVEGMTIHARRFEFEPEFTAKILKQKVRVKEVPISFNPRGYSDGKKITAWDGLIALWTLVKYRFVD